MDKSMKPCPFCGGKPKHYGDWDCRYISCPKCSSEDTCSNVIRVARYSHGAKEAEKRLPGWKMAGPNGYWCPTFMRGMQVVLEDEVKLKWNTRGE